MDTPIFDSIIKKNNSFGFSNLLELVEQVMREQAREALTEAQDKLITPDFFSNTLTEMFTGIDYSKIANRSLNENKSLSDLLQEEIDTPSAEDIRLGLPKLRISEDWGKPESQDRQIIQRFTSSITGTTLKEKLQKVNGIATGSVQMASLGQILGTLVVLEVLYTILSQYTESAGGFIFEGFLAGLFGKNSVQITDVGEDDEGATGKPITDVKLGDREYSLKLLGPGTAVKGSWRNMTEHFAGARDHVVYLDARRSGKAATDSLEFGEFVITLPNFMEIFYEPFKGFVPQEAPVKTKEELMKTLEKYGDLAFGVQFAGPFGGRSKGGFSLKGAKKEKDMAILMKALEKYPEEEIDAKVMWSKEDFTASTKATYLFGSGAQFNAVQNAIKSGNKEAIIAALRKTDGYIKKRQFEFTRNQAESIANFEHIETLKLGEEQLKRTWMIYADILKKTVTPVYMTMARFNENVSKYFMGTEEGAARKALAVAAQQDLGALKEATDEAISAVEQTEKAEYAPELPAE
tara:strand:+ start:48869 stop:50428 length:1560 start_codon:yes stop_codon:yes gene_type:complete